MTETEVTQAVDIRCADEIIALLGLSMPQTRWHELTELLARHRQSSVPVQGEPVAWYTPLGGLIEARQIAQMAYKDIERSKAINGHIDGNPYDVALSALNSVLGELAVLVSSPTTHAPTMTDWNGYTQLIGFLRQWKPGDRQSYCNEAATVIQMLSEALDTKDAAHEATKAECLEWSKAFRDEAERRKQSEAELQALREAVAILRGAMHHRGGPLCSVRYYSDAKCDCGVSQALEQADTLTRKDA